MLLPVPPHIDPEPVPHLRHLARRPAQQPRNQIDLAPNPAESGIAKKGALIDKADEIGQRSDVVWEMSFSRRPDDQEREGVDDDEDDERVIGGHTGPHENVLLGNHKLRCENAAAEDGQQDGDDADERYPGDLEMAGEGRSDRDFERESAEVVEEKGVLGDGAVWTGETGKGLQGAEVEVNGLPEEEEDHPDKRG